MIVSDINEVHIYERVYDHDKTRAESDHEIRLARQLIEKDLFDFLDE